MKDIARQRLEKRWGALLMKHGTCATCVHRDSELHHKAAHCRGNYRRQHPLCVTDGAQPRYRLDDGVIEKMAGAKSG